MKTLIPFCLSTLLSVSAVGADITEKQAANDPDCRYNPQQNEWVCHRTFTINYPVCTVDLDGAVCCQNLANEWDCGKEVR